MSQLMTVSIPIGSREEVKQILEQFGLQYEEAEEGKTISMVGFGGAVGRRGVDIVVRRREFNGLADIGFRQNDDGNYDLICDSDDHIVNAIKNVHLYQKVESVAKQKRRKLRIIEGQLPTSLNSHGGNGTNKVVIEIDA